MKASIVIDDSHLYEDISETEAIEILRRSNRSSSSNSNIESNRIEEVIDDEEDGNENNFHGLVSKSQRHSSSRDIALSSNKNNNSRNATTTKTTTTTITGWRRGTLYIRRKIDSILRIGDIVMDVMKSAGKLLWISSTTLLLMAIPVLYAYDREKSALGSDQLIQ